MTSIAALLIQCSEVTTGKMVLTTEDISAILTVHLKNKNFEFVSHKEIEKKGYVPIGFFSVQNKFCIKYKVKEAVEDLYIFVKYLPKSEYHRETVASSGALSKEALMYEKFLMEFKEKVKGNPVPTCYLLTDDKIVLNDLSEIGFSNLPWLQTFTKKHCEKAIESIAKLNAASLINEFMKNYKIDEYLPELKQEILFNMDDDHTGRKAILCGIKALREVQRKYLPDFSEQLTEYVFNYMCNLTVLMGPSSKYPNVFTHSDLWTNNILFRYENDNVAECCLIDFQMAAIRPITFDFLMLLYCCTDREIRESHYDHFVKYYYKCLSEELSNENIDLSNILMWRDYKKLINELKPVLLAIAPQYLHFVLLPEKIMRSLMQDNEKYSFLFAEGRVPVVLQACQEYPVYKSLVISSLLELFEYFMKIL